MRKTRGFVIAIRYGLEMCPSAADQQGQILQVYVTFNTVHTSDTIKLKKASTTHLSRQDFEYAENARKPSVL